MEWARLLVCALLWWGTRSLAPLPRACSPGPGRLGSPENQRQRRMVVGDGVVNGGVMRRLMVRGCDNRWMAKGGGVTEKEAESEQSGLMSAENMQNRMCIVKCAVQVQCGVG